ncbi:hypothetical protein [Flavobacterium cerinum]|uniref:Phage protein D n=1 Tax=Flavobacterium cerinum TaxID=2502784 RepID=A0A3S3SGN4_9FLAO|nr:hypothetical protein [Flavobacterium cerinum]RWX03360.1 hypothetical protein EPI11_00075 [Flavobacterium cerinum]
MVFCCKVTIGEMVFTSAAEIEIISTWKKFTDTATIKIPKALYFNDGGVIKPVSNIKDLIKTGDKVKIELGYNTILDTRFEGYVARSPRPTIPYEIECEDEMWLLKKKEVSVSIEDATVKQILEKAAPGYEVECADEYYGDFSMVSTTPLKVFDKLRQKAGLHTFFRGKRLVCGLMHSDSKLPETTPNFLFGHNIVDSSLQYRDQEDCKVKIYGSSVQDDGSVIRVDAGEDGGDIERINYAPRLTKKELEKIVKRRLENYKTRGGYSGDLTTFGWPIVQHGQKMRIVDRGIYEKRDSSNYIDEIRINVTPSGGFKQTLVAGKNA